MKNKFISILFFSFLVFFSILQILKVDQKISKSERRELSVFPEFKFNNSYVTKLEKYLLDQFPYRDEFRSIKANFNYKVLNYLDNNDIYLKDNYIFKSNYPTNIDSVQNFINKTNKLLNLVNENNNVYLMIIPDKNYYLNDSDFLHIDYDYIYNEMDKLNIKQIDIRNIFSLNDYYETDTHWKQENLEKVVLKMSSSMNFEYKKIDYSKNYYDRFYGVYYGESAIKRTPERLAYLSNDTINNAYVRYLENSKLNKIYNIEKLYSFDAYEVYLDGASAFIEIFNNSNLEGKELIIFRDSFASSIAPLLLEYYSKITIVDNRYIRSDYFLEKLDFNNQDIIFMYSTLLINNSSVLKG